MRVPWLHKFELRGGESDVRLVKEEILRINNKRER